MRRGFLLGSNAASSADTGARASGPSTGAAQAREDERPSTGAAAEVSVTDEEPLTFNPHPKKPDDMSKADWEQFKIEAIRQLKTMLALGIDTYVTEKGDIWSQEELKQLLGFHDKK